MLGGPVAPCMPLAEKKIVPEASTVLSLMAFLISIF